MPAIFDDDENETRKKLLDGNVKGEYYDDAWPGVPRIISIGSNSRERELIRD